MRPDDVEEKESFITFVGELNMSLKSDSDEMKSVFYKDFNPIFFNKFG